MGPATGVLDGRNMVTVANGMATFSGAILSAVGNGVLGATDGTLSIATAVQYSQNVVPGATTVALPHPAASYTVGQAITLTTALKSASTLTFTGTATIVDQNNDVLGMAQTSATGAVKIVLAAA